AVNYLHSLKTSTGKPQVAGAIGLYGVELGAYAALEAAGRDPQVKVLVLDSLPASADDMVRVAVNTRTSTNKSLVQLFARWGMRIYGLGKYHSVESCDLANRMTDKHVLLLTGDRGDPLRASTEAVSKCFPSRVAELRADLPLTGGNLVGSTGEQEEAYDRP